MSTHGYLVQRETQDAQPEPLSVHLSLLGAIHAAKNAGADVSKADPNNTEFSELAFGTGRTTVVVCVHRLVIEP